MRILVLLPLVLVFAGCTSAPMSVTPTPSTVITATATQPAATLQQLASMYLTAVRPMNEFVCRFDHQHDGEEWVYETWTEFAERFRSHLLAFASRLKTIAWNQETRREARSLIEAAKAAATAYQVVADHPGRGARFRDALAVANDASRLELAAANILRGVLRLEQGGTCT